MTLDKARQLYNQMDNLRMAGVRIRFSNAMHAIFANGGEVDQAKADELLIAAVTAELSGVPLP